MVVPVQDYEAYKRYKRYLLIEDIKSKAIEIGVDLDDKDLEDIADKAERILDKNENLWEIYWMCIEGAIEEY